VPGKRGALVARKSVCAQWPDVVSPEVVSETRGGCDVSGRVLAGIDFSAGSDMALREADERARREGGLLAVSHVVPNPMRSNVLFPQLGQRLALELARLRDAARDEVVRRTTTVTGRDAEEFTTLIEDGLPHAGLVRAAEAWGADLVVVGSHGSSANDRLLLGSVADKVVRYAHCPVLVARGDSSAGDILVATDFSDPALPAVAAAAREALRSSSPITIIHSLDFGLTSVEASGVLFGAVPAGMPPAVSEELKEMTRGMLREALAHHGVEGEVTVAEGPAAPAITAAATRIPARLVVVGTTGRTGVARLVLGSVAEAVVRDAPCSVMVVRLARAPRA
jgi:nucleotide-binding universal stress UspA family protein